MRLWWENDNEGANGVETAVWRAFLQRQQVSERQGFASLEDLFAFLEKETKSCSRGSERPEEEGGCQVHQIADREGTSPQQAGGRS
jgi:hypothetical protein